MNSSYATVAKGLSLWNRERRLSHDMREANTRFDAFVVSCPKAGRTWHRTMLGYYLARLADFDLQELFDLEPLCRRAGVKTVCYTHNGSAFANRLPLVSPLLASSVEWVNRDVLVLVRNPADMLVSAYHHARFRQGRFTGTISDFVRLENTGIDKLLVAHGRWNAMRDQAKSMLICSYEQMLEDPGKALRQALHFVGLEAIDSRLVAEAVAFGSFENMRHLEEQGFFKTRLRRIKLSESARKVRKGHGRADRELGADDRRFIEERIATLGNPFARHDELELVDQHCRRVRLT